MRLIENELRNWAISSRDDAAIHSHCALHSLASEKNGLAIVMTPLNTIALLYGSRQPPEKSSAK